MTGIFINYRRDDTRGLAGRLADNLRNAFGSRAVFMDVDGMKPGLDFVKQLDAQVAQCDVVLAIVGANWFDARDSKGQRRFDSDHDYVRVELASALKRDIPVIPVLVDGATMPPEEALPDDLKSLARRHAMELRYTRFNADAKALELALRDLLPRGRPAWVLPAGGAAVAAAIGLAAFFLWPHPAPPSPVSAPKDVALSEARPQPAPPAASPPAVREAPPSPTVAQPAKAPAAGAPPTDVPAAKSPAPVPAVAAPVKPPAYRGLEPDNYDFKVKFGDSIDAVKAVYNIKSEPISGGMSLMLSLPSLGIRFFFSDANKTLENIRVDAPFEGRIEGVRIGDPLTDLTSRFGEPSRAPWEFGSNKAYLYGLGGRLVRFDITPSGKVESIFQFPNR
ncbi:MAG: toll/interleukin-1 receptor domain-containing protein [Alphaproteobacteria bacterium]